MNFALSALEVRRSVLDQTIRAAFGQQAAGTALSAWLMGWGFDKEAAWLVRRGLSPGRVRVLSGLEELPEAAGPEGCPDIVMLHVPREATGLSWGAWLGLMHRLRGCTAGRPRLLFLETEPLGLAGAPGAVDEDKDLRAIYLSLMSCLEGRMEKAVFVALHERILREAPGEDYGKRLLAVGKAPEAAGLVGSDEVCGVYRQAAERLVLEAHAAKSFECGFIAGPDAELRAIHRLLAPKGRFEDVEARAAKPAAESLLASPLCRPFLLEDALVPFQRSEAWMELERLAGRFLDLSLGKAFNKLSRERKHDLTYEERFAKRPDPAPQPVRPDVSASFNRFAIGGPAVAGLPGFAGPKGLGPAAPAAAPFLPEVKDETVSLTEYAEHALAIVAAAARGCVYTGGVLAEYAYGAPGGRTILGKVVVLNEDAKLLQEANRFAASLGLSGAGGGPRPEQALEAFFNFHRSYIRFYERTRAQVKSLDGFYLGPVAEEDFALPAEEAAPAGDDEDRAGKREKERQAAARLRQGREAHLRSLRENRRKQRPEKPAPVVPESAPEPEEAAPSVQVGVPAAENVRDELEIKRMELEQRIQEQERRKQEQEALRQKLKEEQERRKVEMEELRQRRREQEKVERQKRMEKLAEEKRRREEVRKRRIDSLKDAFQKAQENAQKKQEIKLAQKAQQDEKGGGKRKKGVNTMAIKMMIRFGETDDTIVSRTGVDLEALAGLRQEVNVEDGKA